MPADAGSFGAFYERHYQPVVALGYALSGRWTVAEEAAQEAFLRAYTRWDEVRTYERPDAWVRTVAANVARSRLRRVGAELRAVTRLGNRRQLRPEPDPMPSDVEAVWHHVRALPRRQAEAVALHYLEDLSVREIAAAMDVAEGTVKAHLHRGREALVQRLRAEEEDT